MHLMGRSAHKSDQDGNSDGHYERKRPIHVSANPSKNRHSLSQDPFKCTETYWFGRCLWSMSGSFVLKSRSNGGSCLINHPASHIKLDSALRKLKINE